MKIYPLEFAVKLGEWMKRHKSYYPDSIGWSLFYSAACLTMFALWAELMHALGLV